MQISTELIDSLLWESESTTLDFKSEQYHLAGATDIQKSEIVKDILAFANAFARTDAFILIGVKEVKGGRGQVTGVNEQLEDASLQQLVHGCVKRNLAFSYKAMEMDGKPIGVIHIPRQERPFYSTKDFGRLKKNEVYFRRGSSTAVATPEEVAAMGADRMSSQSLEPILELSLYDKDTGAPLGRSVRLSHLYLDVPARKTIPDYEEHTEPLYQTINFANRDYLRELAEFTQLTNMAHRLSFAVTNSGEVTAADVRLVIEIDALENELYFLSESDIPLPPKSSTNALARYHELVPNIGPSALDIRHLPTIWKIECAFGKIQPKATEVLPDDLFVCASSSNTVDLNMKLFADNLSKPAETKCQLELEVERRSVDLENIKELEFKRFKNSPEGRRLWEDDE